MTRKSILIIDDEQIIRQSLEQDLLDQGYDVEVAEDGESALAKLHRGYDLIVTDLIMDRVSGLEVLATAKERNADQAVFILTGFGELDSAIAALRLGAEDYLLKPYNYDELMLRIERCLSKQELHNTLKIYEKMLSICSECKKIRDKESSSREGENWIPIEEFINKTTGSNLSHGICPHCYQKKIHELDTLIKKGGL